MALIGFLSTVEYLLFSRFLLFSREKKNVQEQCLSAEEYLSFLQYLKLVFLNDGCIGCNRGIVCEHIFYGMKAPCKIMMSSIICMGRFLQNVYDFAFNI